MGNRGISRHERWAPRAEVKVEEKQRRRKEAKNEIREQLRDLRSRWDHRVWFITNTKHGYSMEDYQVKAMLAAMLYVGGQVKSYEEALGIADSMLSAAKKHQK